ncbi:hypothetical protein SNE40_007722 [Patella caerulea]|uniref:RRM domain-containing protein n=1 Tax=Patella caerulea TaxID=87958 RepID=A0AAN8PXU9_PATCE
MSSRDQRHRRSNSRNHRSSSRSRGRYDRNRHRSRSRSRSRNRRSRSRSRNRDRGSRSRRKSSSSSSSSSDVVEVVAPIRSTDPKYYNSRIFIGRLPAGYTKEELSDYFKRYGPILDVICHNKGYGFVQFSNEENAKTAVENERGSMIKGNKVDVKMANEGRSGAGRGAGPGRGGGRGADNGRHPPSVGRGRDRSPLRDPYDDRFRDPYRDPLPPARDDPYYADPYRRPPPIDDRYDRFDDPYRRRDPFDDPYARDPYYQPPIPPPRRGPPQPMECEIIMLNPKLRNYADEIMGKLKALKVVTGILSFPEDQNVQKQLEEMAKQGVLYAVVINLQNELHSSVILNILHGTPQEHRNMPLEDAINLVSKNFETYLQEKALKPAPRAAPAAAPAPIAPHTSVPFLPPSADVTYLLNLLADNRQLTLTEIDKIILYLRERRDKILEAEGKRPGLDDPLYRSESVVKPVQSPVQQEQEELKNKILSILNGGNTATSPPQQPNRSNVGYGDYRRAEPTQPQASTRSANPALINFDNPTVQQALDNLIQTGPNLLKNINPTSNMSHSTGGTSSSGRLSTASPSSPGYGGRPAVSQQSGYGARSSSYPQRPGTQQSPPESATGYGSAASRQHMYGASAGQGVTQPPGMRRY